MCWKAAPAGEKPAIVKTHLRNMVILPEMIGSVLAVYNGKVYNIVEIKPDMVGYYLGNFFSCTSLCLSSAAILTLALVGEFSITYKPIRHGRPGIGATNSSRFIPLK